MTAGSHLGALGALVNNIEGFISKDGKAVQINGHEEEDDKYTHL